MAVFFRFTVDGLLGLGGGGRDMEGRSDEAATAG